MTITSEFWEFSLEVYGRPNAPDLCLYLQNKDGADVNIILFLLWLGRHKLAVKQTGGIDQITDCIAHWHIQIVQNLRTARREMKSHPVPNVVFRDQLRVAIKKLEIQTEQIEQSMLYELFETRSGEFTNSSNQTVATVMARNLEQYLIKLGNDEPHEIVKKLVQLCH